VTDTAGLWQYVPPLFCTQTGKYTLVPSVPVAIESELPTTGTYAQQTVESVVPVGQVAEIDKGAFWLTV